MSGRLFQPLECLRTDNVLDAAGVGLRSFRVNAYFNQVTPENAGKWGSVESTRNQMNWTELDSAYALAKTKGYPFKMHTLIWGQQQPVWIENLPAAEQLAEINEWFAAGLSRGRRFV